MLAPCVYHLQHLNFNNNNDSKKRDVRRQPHTPTTTERHKIHLNAYCLLSTQHLGEFVLQTISTSKRTRTNLSCINMPCEHFSSSASSSAGGKEQRKMKFCNCICVSVFWRCVRVGVCVCWYLFCAFNTHIPTWNPIWVSHPNTNLDFNIANILRTIFILLGEWNNGMP